MEQLHQSTGQGWGWRAACDVTEGAIARHIRDVEKEASCSFSGDARKVLGAKVSAQGRGEGTVVAVVAGHPPEWRVEYKDGGGKKSSECLRWHEILAMMRELPPLRCQRTLDFAAASSRGQRRSKHALARV